MTAAAATLPYHALLYHSLSPPTPFPYSLAALWAELCGVLLAFFWLLKALLLFLSQKCRRHADTAPASAAAAAAVTASATEVRVGQDRRFGRVDQFSLHSGPGDVQGDDCCCWCRCCSSNNMCGSSSANPSSPSHCVKRPQFRVSRVRHYRHHHHHQHHRHHSGQYRCFSCSSCSPCCPSSSSSGSSSASSSSSSASSFGSSSSTVLGLPGAGASSPDANRGTRGAAAAAASVATHSSRSPPGSPAGCRLTKPATACDITAVLDGRGGSCPSRATLHLCGTLRLLHPPSSVLNSSSGWRQRQQLQQLLLLQQRRRQQHQELASRYAAGQPVGLDLAAFTLRMHRKWRGRAGAGGGGPRILSPKIWARVVRRGDGLSAISSSNSTGPRISARKQQQQQQQQQPPQQQQQQQGLSPCWMSSEESTQGGRRRGGSSSGNSGSTSDWQLQDATTAATAAAAPPADSKASGMLLSQRGGLIALPTLDVVQQTRASDESVGSCGGCGTTVLVLREGHAASLPHAQGWGTEEPCEGQSTEADGLRGLSFLGGHASEAESGVVGGDSSPTFCGHHGLQKQGEQHLCEEKQQQQQERQRQQQQWQQLQPPQEKQQHEKEQEEQQQEDDDLIVLRRALEAEREANDGLRQELEAERAAADSAAEASLELIQRLQEEKAALQMELVQQHRISEERAACDEEAEDALQGMIARQQEQLRGMEEELAACRARLQAWEGGTDGGGTPATAFAAPPIVTVTCGDGAPHVAGGDAGWGVEGSDVSELTDAEGSDAKACLASSDWREGCGDSPAGHQSVGGDAKTRTGRGCDGRRSPLRVELPEVLSQKAFGTSWEIGVSS